MPSPSCISPSLARLQPAFPTDGSAKDPPSVQSLIKHLSLLKHTEGGYFAEIDRNPLLVPNPFQSKTETTTAIAPRSGDDSVRNASTTIHYLLTPSSPQGNFHRNLASTVHTVIRGRGRYVLIHADEDDVGGKGKKRVETFKVGNRVEEGEKSVWVVKGGKFKASFLEADGEEGLLISEVVVPGFEYSDHDFLTEEKFKELVTEEQAEELEWLVRKGAPPKQEELL